MSKHSSRVRSPSATWVDGWSGGGKPIRHAEFGGSYTSIERLGRDNYRVVVMSPDRKKYQSGNAATEAEAHELRSRLLAEG